MDEGLHYTEKLDAGAEGCTRRCVCGISVCTNFAHQNWLCECGHNRVSHVMPMAYYMSKDYFHPHRCYSAGCTCVRLQMADGMLSEEEIVEGLRCIEFELRTEPPIDGGDAPPDVEEVLQP